MNKERILELADLIEKQPHTSWQSRNGFNMSDYFHTCGTPCCVAGWAAAMQFNDASANLSSLARRESTFIGQTAQDYLGLGYDQADELFCPSINGYDAITPAQAARTLRHLAETGEVVWSLEEPA